MIRTKLALKVLTKNEQKHLTVEANIHSMAAFIKTRKVQLANEKSTMDAWMSCSECRHIAQKLGVE